MKRRNNGVRKRCGCKPANWPKCAHPWHMNFKWKGVHYRLSLEKVVGRRIESKSDALAEADAIRAQIRAGTFRTENHAAERLTFAAFADVWEKREGARLANAKDNGYRLGTIKAFVLPATKPTSTFGGTALDAITADHIEAFRDDRRAANKSAVAVNHDLKLLRKMFAWAVRKGYLQRTPFRIGGEPAIRLEREIPRNRRFEDDGIEQRILDAANPLLRAVVIAMLDTGCRPGEIMSLQWRDVSMERREITIRAEKEKTRRERIIPMSTRLHSTLEMRRLDPAGAELPSDAYVFGTPLGARVKSVREAWKTTAEAVGMAGFQLRDLRHEAGSRFDEAGMPINYVANMLGHSSLATTSRYLNINRRGLRLAMEKFETARAEAVAQTLHKADPAASAATSDAEQSSTANPLVH